MNWNPFNTAKKKRIADLRARIDMLDAQLDILENISSYKERIIASCIRDFEDQYGVDVKDWPLSATSLLDGMEASQLRNYKEQNETLRTIHTLAVELRNS